MRNSHAYQIDAGLLDEYLKIHLRNRGVRRVIERMERSEVKSPGFTSRGPGPSVDPYFDWSGFGLLHFAF
jgi:hypothetical protein